MSNLSLKMKLLSAKSIVKARVFNNSFIWSQIFLTRRCNLNCSYCGVVDNSRPNPSLVDIYNWLDISKKVGCLGVSFFGGEPFLRKDLNQIIKVTTFKNLYSQLSTNLSLINERKLDNLSNSGLGELRFSFDSIGGLKNSKKTLAKLDENISFLLKNRNKWNFDIKATFVITPENWRLVMLVLDYLKKYEVPLSIVPIEPKKMVKNNPTMSESNEGLSYTQLKNITEKLIHKKRDGALIDVSEEYLRQIPDYWVGKADWDCKAGQYTFTVDVDGNIGYCSSLDRYFDHISVLESRDSRNIFRDYSLEVKTWCTKNCLSGCQFNTSYYANNWRDFIKTM